MICKWFDEQQCYLPLFHNDDQKNFSQDIHMYNYEVMVDRHLYSDMWYFDNNLLFFHNEFLPNRIHIDKQRSYWLFDYMYLKRRKLFHCVEEEKRDTIIPASSWFTRSIIEFASCAIETR
jgi:hypothetical protein